MAVNHEAMLVENVTNLMTCDTFNDVRIRLSNGVQVEANKVVLAAMSTFFRKKLQEKLTNSIDVKLLEVDVNVSSSKEMLDLVIKYFYTGKMTFEALCLKDLLDLLNLLLFLELEVLSTVVEKFIIDKIKKGGFILEKMLILSCTAEAYCFKEIVSSMLYYLGLKINDVSKLPEVKYMSFEFLESLIKDAKDNYIKARFFARFETVRLWIETNDVDDEVKNKLISMFDLKNFTVQQLTSTVRESKLFSDSSILDVLSETVIELQKDYEELDEDVVSERKSNHELRKNIDTLKATIKAKEQTITSYYFRENEAKEKADRAIKEQNNAKTKAENLQTENTKLLTENSQLNKKLARAKKNHPCDLYLF